jgi:hypothetical protein
MSKTEILVCTKFKSNYTKFEIHCLLWNAAAQFSKYYNVLEKLTAPTFRLQSNNFSIKNVGRMIL